MLLCVRNQIKMAHLIPKFDDEPKSTGASGNNRVAVKLMCEKFENFSSDQIRRNNVDREKFAELRSRARSEMVVPPSTRNGVEEDPASSNRLVPTRPLRRNKRNSSSDIPDSNAPTTATSLPSHEKTKNPLSVRDRLKIFEKSHNATNSTSTAMIEGYTNTSTTDAVKELVAPVKPPRSAPVTRSLNEDSPSNSSQITSSPQKKNSFSPLSLMNVHHIISSSSSKDQNEKQSKSTKIAQNKFPKVTAFKSYVKNLSSTANQICDKVKTKSGNVFVDLTPTTVSPPKRYGTLKRSHSEEHIYAEPSECSPKKKEAPVVPTGGLHYMCSPIVDVAAGELSSLRTVYANDSIDEREKKMKFNKTSMRSIIYESFSMLRKPQVLKRRENETIVEGVDGDSASDVSVKDVQERIIYVKSVKKQMSVSSICIAPKLFDVILIIAISENGPQILFKHPQKSPRGYDYPLIPHICFPDYQHLEQSTIYKSETFNFTLENGDDDKIFGYCHRILGWPEQKHGFCANCPISVCLLSSISAPIFYSKVLLEIEKHMILPMKKCMEYMMDLQKLGIPNAGASISIPDNTEEISKRVVVTRPLDFHTVSIDLTKTMQLLDVDVILKVLSSLLLERRVLLLSKNARNLFSCYKAITSLLYPFQWQHLMIPMVPSCLLIQCCAESPYILGVVSLDYEKILDLLSEHQLLIVDADKGHILKSCGDEDTILPRKIHKAVVGALNLSKNMTDPTEMMRDIMISEAVVHMFVEIFGRVESHLSVNDCGSVTFQKEAFQKSCPSKSIQAFLQWFSESQMFEIFIEEYIWRINYREICHSQQYTFFEKRIEEYKLEMTHESGKISKKIGKTVRNIGEKLKSLKLN